MKIAKIFLSIALLISLTQPLSTAINNNNNLGFGSIPELLKFYKLPAGLFPDAVQSFNLTYVGPGTYNVSILLQFQKACSIKFCIFTCFVSTPDFNGEYGDAVTATISDNKVTNLKGVSVSFTGYQEPYYKISEVQAYLNTAYQFKSEQAGFSPVFLFEKLEKPPSCFELFPKGYGPSHLLVA